MKNTGFLLILFLGLGSNIAWAGNVFKCVDANGKTLLSDRPCAADSEVIKKKQKAPKKAPESQNKQSSGGYGNFIERARKVKPEAPEMPK